MDIVILPVTTFKNYRVEKQRLQNDFKNKLTPVTHVTILSYFTSPNTATITRIAMVVNAINWTWCTALTTTPTFITPYK
jgi:hypothetical protein